VSISGFEIPIWVLIGAGIVFMWLLVVLLGGSEPSIAQGGQQAVWRFEVTLRPSAGAPVVVSADEPVVVERREDAPTLKEALDNLAASYSSEGRTISAVRLVSVPGDTGASEAFPSEEQVVEVAIFNAYLATLRHLESSPSPEHVLDVVDDRFGGITARYRPSVEPPEHEI
jgi:hypothetical protein